MNNVYVINLAQHTERWTQAVKELGKFGVTPTRFEGIYGKNLTEKEIKEKTTGICRNMICNYGTIGCFLSHITLWEKLVQDSYNDFYLILEDDFKIDDFESILRLYQAFQEKKIDSQISSKYSGGEIDYLSLYTNTMDYCITAPFEINKVKICKKIYPNTTLGYFITKNGAKKMLGYIEGKVRYHIDLYISYLDKTKKNINIFNTKKNLISRADIGYVTSSISNSNKKTLLSYFLPEQIYFEFKFPLFVYKLKNTFTLETVLSFILGIIFIILFNKKRRWYFLFIGLVFFLNFILSII
jgi:GR25 family glycosyltransferase involved in LPS biosynthesis